MKLYLMALTLFASQALASGSYHHNNTGPAGPAGPPGKNGKDGVNGQTVYVSTTASTALTTESYSAGLNDLDIELSGAVATGTAMASIPTLSHYAPDHGHTSIGIGGGTYNDQSALALGIEHHKNDISLKAMVGVSTSSSPAVGLGGAWVFK